MRHAWIWAPVAAVLLLGSIGRTLSPETTRAVAAVLITGER